MANVVYNRGLDLMNDWTTGTFKFLLLEGAGYTPDSAHDFVSSVAGDEVGVAGYTRQTAGTKTRTVDDTADRITYDCADPAFGSLVAGETVTGMVLYLFATNDADSQLVAYYDLADVPTDGNPVSIVISAEGVLYADQGA